MPSRDLIFRLRGEDVNASAAMRKVTLAAETSTRSIQKAFGDLPKYAAVATVGAAAAATYLAANFQQASLRLVTDAGESAKNLNLVKAGMLNISTQTGLTATEVATGMYTVESAGYHGAAGLKVMQAAAEGARIGGADVKTVADALTTAMTDYHFPADQAANVTSKLIATVGQGKTTMEELAGSLHNVLPTAASLHLSFGQVAGAMATMTGEGISADQASQNLNHAIIALASPTQVQTKEMAAMGLNSTTVAAQLGKKGLTGTLSELVNAITSHMGPAGLVLQNAFSHSQLAAQSASTEYKSLGGEAQKLATSYMNGTITLKQWVTGTKAMAPVQANLAHEWAASYMASKQFSTALTSNQGAAQTFTGALSKMTGGQMGLSVALHLTGDHLASFQNNVRIISAASAEANGHVKGWSETQGNFNQQLAQARSAIEAVAINIGGALLPPLTQAAKMFSGFFIALMNGNPAALLIAGTVVTITGALTGLFIAQKVFDAMAAGARIVAFGMELAKAAQVGWTVATYGGEAATYALQKATLLQTAAMKIGMVAQIAFNAVMDANPIAILIIAIVALIAGIVLLVTHWKQVCAFIQDVWGAVCKWWGDTMTTLGTLIGTVFANISAVVTGVVNAVVGFVSQHWQLLLAIFLGPLGLIIDFVSTNFKAIAGFIGGVVNTIVGVVKTGIGWVSSFWQAEVHGWQVVIQAVWNFIRPFVTVAIGAIRTVITAEINVISSIWHAVWGAVSSFFAGIWRAIISVVSTAINAVVGFFHPIASRIIGAIGNAGAMLIDVGRNIIQGLINGLTAAAGAVFSTIKGIASNVASIAKSVFGIHSPSTVFHDIGANVAAGLNNGLLGSVGQIQSATNTLSNAVISAFNSKSITKSAEQGALAAATAFSKTLESESSKRAATQSALKSATSSLANLKKSETTLSSNVTSAAMSGGDITSFSGGGAGMAHGLAALVTQTKLFSTDLMKLKKMGLDSTSLSQLISAGVSGGGLATAEQLISDPVDVRQIAGLQAQLRSSASDLGATAGATQYGSQISAAQHTVTSLTRRENAETKGMQKTATRDLLHIDTFIAGSKSANEIASELAFQMRGV